MPTASVGTNNCVLSVFAVCVPYLLLLQRVAKEQ